jgi:uncharacterized protein YbjT (DUF2867 family)
MDRPGPILVTSATGKQGSAAVAQLAVDGWPVIALVRNPDKARVPQGAKAIRGDMLDRELLREAMRGVYGVFSVQPLVDGNAEKEVEMGVNVLAAARDAGVQHFVYSSAIGAGAKAVPHFESKGRIERAIRESGIPYTILRPAGFMENLLVPQSKKSILNGKLLLLVNERLETWWIAVEDIGRFAAIAFDQPSRFLGRELALAGDKRDGPQAAAILSKVIGRPITVGQLPWIAVRLFAGKDVATMCDWLESNRIGIDLGALRILHPGILTLEDWALKQQWK